MVAVRCALQIGSAGRVASTAGARRTACSRQGWSRGRLCVPAARRPGWCAPAARWAPAARPPPPPPPRPCRAAVRAQSAHRQHSFACGLACTPVHVRCTGPGSGSTPPPARLREQVPTCSVCNLAGLEHLLVRVPKDALDTSGTPTAAPLPCSAAPPGTPYSIASVHSCWTGMLLPALQRRAEDTQDRRLQAESSF